MKDLEQRVDVVSRASNPRRAHQKLDIFVSFLAAGLQRCRAGGERQADGELQLRVPRFPTICNVL